MGEHEHEQRDYLLGNKIYDILSYIALIILPALATFYLTLAGLWNFPEPEKVAATIVAVDTLLGAMLKISKKSYDNSEERFDGDLKIGQNENGIPAFTFDFKEHLPVLAERKSELTFKVKQVE